MKQLYIFILFFAINLSLFAQTATFNGADNAINVNWSNSANWVSSNFPDVTEYVRIKYPTSSVDASYSMLQLQTESGVAMGQDYIVNNGSGTLTIDVNSSINNATNGNIVGISHQASDNFKLTLDNKIILTNTNGTPFWAGIKNATSGILEFGTTSELTLNAPKTSTLNDGTINFSGALNGSSIELSLTGTGQHYFLPGFSIDQTNLSTIKFLNGSPTLNINTTDDINIFSSTIISQNSGTYNLNVNAQNSLACRFFIFNDSSLNININKNLENLTNYRLFNNSIMNITIHTSVTKVWFQNNSGESQVGTGTSAVNIINFVPGKVRFGTDNTGLTAAQLLRISGDGVATGEALALDANGYLVLASTLSTKNYNAFDFAVYPNPVKDNITINTQEPLRSVEIYNLLGKTVFTAEKIQKSIDISSLDKGLYILKLTSEKGISTKKIVKG